MQIPRITRYTPLPFPLPLLFPPHFSLSLSLSLLSFSIFLPLNKSRSSSSLSLSRSHFKTSTLSRHTPRPILFSILFTLGETSSCGLQCPYFPSCLSLSIPSHIHIPITAKSLPPSPIMPSSPIACLSWIGIASISSSLDAVAMASSSVGVAAGGGPSPSAYPRY